MTKTKLSNSGIVDYQDMVSIDASIEDRKRAGIGNIWANEITCLKCNETVRSKNRHHVAWCKCGECAIDGGSWYSKATGNPGDYEVKTTLFTHTYK